jgi:DNA recombination protein RmuC
VLGLKGLRIEKSAMAIIHHLERLRGDFERFRKEFEILGTHLTNAKGKYDDAEKRLTCVDERLTSVGELPMPQGRIENDINTTQLPS